MVAIVGKCLNMLRVLIFVVRGFKVRLLTLGDQAIAVYGFGDVGKGQVLALRFVSFSDVGKGQVLALRFGRYALRFGRYALRFVGFGDVCKGQALALRFG